MKILVMGAGAVGAYFGARLKNAGDDVVLCARGENLRAFCDRGIEIESFRDGHVAARVSATENPRDFAPYDLILFCVKAYDTDRAAEAIRGCIAADGAIVTLQNGVENEQRLCDLLGPDFVMGGNARVGVEMVKPGKIVHVSNGFVDIGEIGGGKTDRLRRIVQVFERAGILGKVTDDLRTARWDKLLWNGAFNVVCALTRRNVGAIIDDADGLALVRTLMEEILKIARADGAKLGYDRIEYYLDHSRKNLRAVRPSTLQDLERGKPLEHEALSGAVVRAANRHAIAVPISQTACTLLRLLSGAQTRN